MADCAPQEMERLGDDVLRGMRADATMGPPDTSAVLRLAHVDASHLFADAFSRGEEAVEVKKIEAAGARVQAARLMQCLALSRHVAGHAGSAHGRVCLCGWLLNCISNGEVSHQSRST
jgi:hypothetical protein